MISGCLRLLPPVGKAAYDDRIELETLIGVVCVGYGTRPSLSILTNPRDNAKIKGWSIKYSTENFLFSKIELPP